VVDAIDALSNWTAAWAKGERVDPGPDKSPCGDLPVALDREWQAWRSLWQAVSSGADDEDEASCQDVANHYSAALDLARRLPYGKLLLKLWEGVPDEAERLKARAAALASERRRMQTIRDAFSRGALAGIDTLRRELNRTPGDERLTELGLQQAKAWRDRGEMDYARRLLGGMVVAAAPRLLGELVALRHEISAAPAPELVQLSAQPSPAWTEAYRRLAEVEQIVQAVQSAPALAELTEEERMAFMARLDRLAALVQPHTQRLQTDAADATAAAVAEAEPPAPALEKEQEPSKAGEAAEQPSPDATAGVREPQALLSPPAPLRQEEQRAPELHEQVDALKAQAGKLIGSGLVNDLEPAINRIAEALVICEALGDAGLTGELRQVLNYYGEIQKQVVSCLRIFEEHKHAQQWGTASRSSGMG
jgi:hypothetical protein